MYGVLTREIRCVILLCIIIETIVPNKRTPSRGYENGLPGLLAVCRYNLLASTGTTVLVPDFSVPLSDFPSCILVPCESEPIIKIIWLSPLPGTLYLNLSRLKEQEPLDSYPRAC